MTTLVIHPEDASTDFLIPIYEDMDATVIRNYQSRSIMKKLIQTHDRVIMLGHGDDGGLFGFGKYVINSKIAFALKAKLQSVFIWCHADDFVKRYRLKGFVTGMIVSDIEASNTAFTQAIKKSIHLPPADMKTLVKSQYVSLDNEIIMFNSTNIYSF